MTQCRICNKELNNPKDKTSENCGGDCLRCMADAGDPLAIEMIDERCGVTK